MKRRWDGVRVPGFAALLLTCLWAPVWDANAAKVSAETGEGFDRLLFAWPSQVDYTAQRFGNELLIQFVARVDGNVTAAAGTLGGFIASARLDPSGREVVVRLTGSHRLRTYRDGNNVVIDVGKASVVANRPAVNPASSGRADETSRPSPSVEPRLVVRVGEHPTYYRVVFDWPTDTPYSVTEADGRARITFGNPARIDGPELAASLPKAFASLRAGKSVSGNAEVVIPILDGMRVRHFLSGAKVVVDLIQDPNAKSSAAQAAPVSVQTASNSAPEEASKPIPREGEKPDFNAQVRQKTATQAVKSELARKFGLTQSQEPVKKMSPTEPLEVGKAP
ncbi:MAG: hypothetical protein OSB69_10000, partial [Alphaproteobacteria bacterium]|nr:hypothetical protein [Alphaproteobacteria bacterium]